MGVVLPVDLEFDGRERRRARGAPTARLAEGRRLEFVRAEHRITAMLIEH
jgi:hypothetical protein